VVLPQLFAGKPRKLCVCVCVCVCAQILSVVPRPPALCHPNIMASLARELQVGCAGGSEDPSMKCVPNLSDMPTVVGTGSKSENLRVLRTEGLQVRQTHAYTHAHNNIVSWLRLNCFGMPSCNTHGSCFRLPARVMLCVYVSMCAVWCTT